MSEPVIVRMVHVRAAGMCSSGARVFCERHNIDWADFLKNGIEVEKLIGIDDELLKQVIKAAENGR